MPALSVKDPYRPQLLSVYSSEVKNQEYCGYIEAEGPAYHGGIVALEGFFIIWQVLNLKIILFWIFSQLLVSQVQIVIYCNIELLFLS